MIEVDKIMLSVAMNTKLTPEEGEKATALRHKLFDVLTASNDSTLVKLITLKTILGFPTEEV